MKTILTCYALCSSLLLASESEFMRAFNEQRGQKKQTPEQVIELHSEGAERVAREQDELSADVQELIQSETNDKVIKFLEEAEELMAGATDKLEAKDTSGPTIAIETEIIEKIADAAKQKQQSGQGQSQSNGALMQMLQEMMQASGAKEGNDGQASDGEGEDAASKGGDGPEGDSNSANTNQNEESSGSTETRRLPKKSGSAGTTMPREFQKALDAYNKGLDSQ